MARTDDVNPAYSIFPFLQVRLAKPGSPAPRGFDFGDVDFPHFHHRRKNALGLGAAGVERIGQSAGRDLPRQAPAILAPAAGAFLPAVADDRVPVAIRFLLRIGRDEEGKRLAVPEFRPAIQPETGNAEDGELHREHIALFARWIVARRLMHRDHFAIGKRRRVKPSRFQRVLIEPKADRILGNRFLHKRISTTTGEINQPS